LIDSNNWFFCYPKLSVINVIVGVNGII